VNTRASEQSQQPDSDVRSSPPGNYGRSEQPPTAGDSTRRFGQRFARSAAGALSPGITAMIQFDHTHVLALLRRFRPWTSESRKRAIVANACLALEVHALLEEEIFYPALREAAGHSEVLDKSVPEHDEMRRVIAKLRATELTDPTFDETFRTLMRTVLHHVADEEAVVLPLAETYMTDRLGSLGLEMTRRRMQLLGPNIGEVVVTTARSFPVLTAATAGGLLALGWWVAFRAPHLRRPQA
jgi:hemerythrin superfamily protein